MKYLDKSFSVAIGVCLKFDCKNRKKKCDDCIRFSKYIKENKNGN